MKAQIDVKELTNFLYYLQDKIDYCYKYETYKAIQKFIENL